MRQSLMIKAVLDASRNELLRNLMRAGASVNFRDERSVSLLHYAAVAPNPDGINMLLGGDADSQMRDAYGQTPLHVAIRRFCSYAEDGQGDSKTEEDLLSVVQQLLNFTKKSELFNSRDHSGMSVRDILHERENCICRHAPVCKHDDIRELLDRHQPIVRRRHGDQNEEPWKGWSPPAGGTLQRRACERSKAIIAEFSDGAGGPQGEYDVPSVHDLIYQKELGPVRILSRLGESHLMPMAGNTEVTCRWIHVPANNVSDMASCPMGKFGMLALTFYLKEQWIHVGASHDFAPACSISDSTCRIFSSDSESRMVQ